MYHLHTKGGKKLCEVRYKVKHTYSKAPLGREVNYCPNCQPLVNAQRTKAIQLIREAFRLSN